MDVFFHTRWSRWRGFVAIALVLAAALPAEAADTETPTVYTLAILPFAERGNKVNGLGAQVTDLVFANLVADPHMYLVDREDLEKLLKEHELNLSGLVDPAEATQVGQLTGAKIIVTGSVFEISTSLYLVAKIIGTETTRVVGASVKGSVRDDLDALVEDLASQVGKTVADRAGELIARPKTRDDRLAALRRTLEGAKRPTVRIEIAERHVGQIAIDPAAETEIGLFCAELGFYLIDPKQDNAKAADVLLTGEGFSEFATRHGNLVSVKARLELKAIDVATGRVMAIDRQTAVEVDLTEQIAGKAALQEAAADLAERLLPKIVEHAKDKKSKAEKRKR